MSPKKTTSIVCAILFIATILIVGLLYRSNLNEADDLLSNYIRNTQQFERSQVVSVIEELRGEGTLGSPVIDTGGLTMPGIPGMPGDIEMPATLEELIMLPNEDAWKLCTNGAYKDTVKEEFSYHESTLNGLKKSMEVSFDVPVWAWDGNSLNKVASTTTISCNKVIQPLVEAAMRDIYNHPSQPVMSLSCDYSVRRITKGKRPSAHAYGCAFDFNAKSTEGGYGNTYGGKVPTKAQWDKLPETQAKHEIFYVDCPAVCIWKSYGFCWGGDYQKTKDGMHFSFIGDNSRDIGQDNYNAYKNRRN